MVYVHRVGDIEVYERLRFVPLTVGTIAAGAVLAVLPLVDPRYFGFSAGVGLVVWLLWAFLVWPRVTLGPDGARVRNTFQTTTFPLTALDGVASGLALEFRLKTGQRVRAWAVPGHQNMGAEAIHYADVHAGGFVPVWRVGQLAVGSAATPAGQVAGSITRRLAIADASTPVAVSALREDSGADAVRRFNVIMMLTTIALIGLAVAGIAAGTT